MPTIKADYIRTPADNIRDKISRELEYHAVDGNISYQSDNELHNVTFDDALDKLGTARRLRAATSKSADFIYRLMDAGVEILKNTRLEQSNSAMLTIAEDKEAAYALGKYSESIGLTTVVLTEDDPDPSTTLKNFKSGSGDNLVAVGMMTEGTNVPRLRVGVYAAKKKAPLFLQQVLNRLSRKEHLAQEGSGKWVGPADPDILEEVRKIATVNLVTLSANENSAPVGSDNVQVSRPASSFVPISAYATTITGHCGEMIAEQYELQRARALRKERPTLYRNISDVQLGKIAAQISPQNQPKKPSQIETYDQARNRLSKTASKLSNKLAWLRSVEPKEIHTLWIANGNARHEEADNAMLQAKIDWLVNEIEREQLGRPDASEMF